jgi:hypothetical protein
VVPQAATVRFGFVFPGAVDLDLDFVHSPEGNRGDAKIVEVHSAATFTGLPFASSDCVLASTMRPFESCERMYVVGDTHLSPMCRPFVIRGSNFE